MNFKKLQEMQRALDDAILKEKPEMTAEERFEKTLVALSVEIAELANTAEHFKFWKENKGKIDSERFRKIEYQDTGVFYEDWGLSSNEPVVKPEQAHKLTLVEEASDCLHFILSLANQLNVDLGLNFDKKNTLKLETNEKYYLFMLNRIHLLNVRRWEEDSITMLYSFLGYTESLGITQEELEQAYYDKNEINYQRLEQGY